MDIKRQKAILVGFNNTRTKEDININDSMSELKELAGAAGAEVLDIVIQNKVAVDARFYIGKGKVEEIAHLCEFLSADLVIFNDELSGAQMRNLVEAIGVTVIDRTAVILDIFAKRAKTREGKLQVELAQLKYRLPKLRGMGVSLSRVGGSAGGAGNGIGNRGPGEQKLELDRRRIDDRIVEIRRQIEEVKKIRATQRVKKSKSDLPVVAIVGYTNAGKSTLMNYFVSSSDKDDKKKVFEKDMLFATLETSNRKVTFEDNKSLILIDTVGFVSKLPHNLVEAFKATLEEVTEADLLIHLVDSSNDKYEMQIGVTEKVLKEIGVVDTPSIIVFNKIDKVDKSLLDVEYPNSIKVSAKEGLGITELVEEVKTHVFSEYVKVEMLIPYSEGKIVSYLNDSATIFEQECIDVGTKLLVEISAIDNEKLKRFIVS